MTTWWLRPGHYRISDQAPLPGAHDLAPAVVHWRKDGRHLYVLGPASALTRVSRSAAFTRAYRYRRATLWAEGHEFHLCRDTASAKETYAALIAEARTACAAHERRIATLRRRVLRGGPHVGDDLRELRGCYGVEA